MSRFTDELRNLDGMRDADELLPAAAVIIDEMENALREIKRMNDEALPKFNWGNSALDANAIFLLNQAPITVNRALAMLEELSK